jgi:phosphomevalonate kinase
VATAPGKVMIAGEYAVLDGGLAVVAAVDRRARATLAAAPVGELSVFLQAAKHVIAEVLGDEVAALVDRTVVDTRSLSDGERKLGLGSSAAATVAAISLVAGVSGHGDDPALILRMARNAHARAQAQLGAAGSGADVAASATGGVIGFRSGKVRVLTLPSDLTLHFAWTGAPADTATLVAAVTAARQREQGQPAAGGAAAAKPVTAALDAIGEAAHAFAAAGDAAAAIAAIKAGAKGMAKLAAATGVALVPPALDDLRERLKPLGAAAKTTGAGGGDVIVIAAPRTVARPQIDTAVVEAGLWPLHLAVDTGGVDFARGAE